MGFAKVTLGRKIALHVQQNESQLPHSEDGSGEWKQKSFFPGLLFNLKAIFPAICFMLNI